MRKDRNYGIDLLRLVLMFMVCLLHVLGQGGILDACSEGTIEFRTYWFLKIAFYYAVDAFGIISGYMAVNRPQKYEKIINMWFQTFFYSCIVTLVLTALGIRYDGSKLKLLVEMLLFAGGNFWYFTSYFLLFFAIPVLNPFLFSLDERTAKKVLLLMLTLCSGIGVLNDPFQMNWGFSPVWLMVLYCIGVLARRIRLFEKKRSITLVLWLAGCVLVTWGWRAIIGMGGLSNYLSPLILLSGMVVVILFSRLHLKGTVIARLSPLAFGVYLFHSNQVIWNVVLKDNCAFVATKNIVAGVGYVFVLSFGLFAVGLLVEWVRCRLFGVLRIPALSQRIVALFDVMLERMLDILN